VRPRIALTASSQEAAGANHYAAYCRALEQAGGEPHVLRGDPQATEVRERLLAFDGLLLPGGDDIAPEAYGGRDHPALRLGPADRDALEMHAVRIALDAQLPTLGICRGIQVMNVALGGTLYEDIDAQYERPESPRVRHRQTPEHSRQDPTHPVDLEAGSKLAALFGSASVDTNSMHHQALRRIAFDLKVVGRSRDGIVEAVELRSAHPFFLGVQWHPEEMVERDGPSRKLLSEFVAHAAVRARRGVAQPS
jgi:putative glutamine amidotransferase